MNKRYNKKQIANVFDLSRVQLEQEIADLMKKKEVVLLSEGEYRRLANLKIELGHRKSKMRNNRYSAEVQGGTGGSTK